MSTILPQSENYSLQMLPATALDEEVAFLPRKQARKRWNTKGILHALSWTVQCVLLLLFFTIFNRAMFGSNQTQVSCVEKHSIFCAYP